MKATIVIVEDHPSGQPAAVFTVDGDLTQVDYHHIQKVFERWWHTGGGIFMVGHLEVLRVKSLIVEIDEEELTVVGSS